MKEVILLPLAPLGGLRLGGLIEVLGTSLERLTDELV